MWLGLFFFFLRSDLCSPASFKFLPQLFDFWITSELSCPRGGDIGGGYIGKASTGGRMVPKEQPGEWLRWLLFALVRFRGPVKTAG